jgi:transcriptional regulator with XRE-family HTH domain
MNEIHWTAKSTDAFIQRMTFDYITQLMKKLDTLPMTQADLAKKLGVTEGAVSQKLNAPRNLQLKTVVSYARALGLKVALVAYDDGDPGNERGPINSEIFSICWERANRPADFFSLQATEVSAHRPFNREYVIVAGQHGYIVPKTADNSPGGSLREAQNLLLLCKEHQSTSGKPTVEYKDKMILRLVS